MAKNKKSKILAMALCASVMAGIYASPVMAKEFPLDSNSSVTTETTISTGGYTQNEVRVNISDGISSDTIGTFYSNEEEAGFKTDYTMTASTFTLEAGGKTWASLTVDGLTYTNQTTLNNVRLTADGLTFSNLRNPEDAAVLNAAAINSWNEKTQNINSWTTADTTAFDGSVIADSFGTTKVNGNRAFWVNKDGMMEAAYGQFKVGANGEVTATNFNGIALEKNNSNEILLDSINVTQLSNNTAGITRENVTKNITKTNIENSSITSAGELYINKANGQTNFSVDKYGNANVRKYLIANGISVNNNRFTVDEHGTVHSDGTVYSESDFKTLDEKGNEKYSLNTVGADLEKLTGNVGNIGGNVAGIKRDDANLLYGEGRTEIEGVVAVDGKDGRFYVLGEDGTAAVITNDGTARFGFENEKHVYLENGELKINDANKNTVASLSENGLTLGLENLNEAQLSNINNVIGEGGVVTAADGSVIGGVGFTSGAMTDVVSINGAAVEGVGNGGLKISGVELENGLINGVNINDLDKAVAGTSANIGGIEREAEDGAAPGEGTTTIENNLKVSGDKINMFGDTGLTFDKGTMNDVNVINVSGNIGFNGSNVHFSYGSDGKTTTLGGLALTVDQIANDVSAIKEKTDHITVDDKGNVTISADDGSSLTVGKDGTSTGQGGQVTTDGNHTVNGDLDVDGSGQIDKDLTVGGDLEVGGSITTGNTTIDGSGMTVGDGTTITDGKVSSTEGAFGNITFNTGTIGNATFDENGMTVGGTGGTSINHDEVRVGGDENGEGGSYMNNTDVVTGEGNSLNDTANRVGNLEQGVSELNNRVGELEDRIDKVGAMAAAIANLRTMGYDPAAPTEVAVGLGQYRDETGAALGLFHYPNRDFMLSLSVSTSGDEVMGGIGATWKFGRKSPEKVAEIKKAQAEADARRAEEAKLAKAEEMKQAAKEAKIKAQQERHAKLAAERAAQAEAAK